MSQVGLGLPAGPPSPLTRVQRHRRHCQTRAALGDRAQPRSDRGFAPKPTFPVSVMYARHAAVRLNLISISISISIPVFRRAALYQDLYADYLTQSTREIKALRD